MTIVKSQEIRDVEVGFEVSDLLSPGARIYTLPAYPNILVGKDGKRLKAELAVAHYDDESDHDDFFKVLDLAKSAGLEVIIAVNSQFRRRRMPTSPAEGKLSERLQPFYDTLVKREFNTFFDGVFNEQEYVLMLSQCFDHQEYNTFLERCLMVGSKLAEKSITGRRKPNYLIDVPKLLKSIENYISRDLKLTSVPTEIVGYNWRMDQLARLAEESTYVHAIVQKNGSSFTYSPAMQRQVARLTTGLEDALEKSRVIFDWITSNIRYGAQKRRAGVEYRGAAEVYEDREGVCGESAALQVTMERLAGNIAFLVRNGARHACAAHLRPNGKVVLIDTTNPDGFDAKYEHFEIVSDEYSLARNR